MMLKEEEELKAKRLLEAIEKDNNNIENNNENSNRSMSLGIRNNTFKSNNISFNKFPNPLNIVKAFAVTPSWNVRNFGH